MTEQPDDIGDDIDESPEETREWFRQEISTRGLRTAYVALTKVCKDPKAPAPAKATAGVALLRAAGVFARVDDDDGPKDPSAMTAKELEQEVARLTRKRRSLKSGSDGVFD